MADNIEVKDLSIINCPELCRFVNIFFTPDIPNMIMNNKKQPFEDDDVFLYLSY